MLQEAKEVKHSQIDHCQWLELRKNGATLFEQKMGNSLQIPNCEKECKQNWDFGHDIEKPVWHSE
jgi:hypothetical protein